MGASAIQILQKQRMYQSSGFFPGPHTETTQDLLMYGTDFGTTLTASPESCWVTGEGPNQVGFFLPVPPQAALLSVQSYVPNEQL